MSCNCIYHYYDSYILIVALTNSGQDWWMVWIKMMYLNIL